MCRGQPRPHLAAAFHAPSNPGFRAGRGFRSATWPLSHALAFRPLFRLAASTRLLARPFSPDRQRLLALASNPRLATKLDRLGPWLHLPMPYVIRM